MRLARVCSRKREVLIHAWIGVTKQRQRRQVAARRSARSAGLSRGTGTPTQIPQRPAPAGTGRCGGLRGPRTEPTDESHHVDLRLFDEWRRRPQRPRRLRVVGGPRLGRELEVEANLLRQLADQLHLGATTRQAAAAAAAKLSQAAARLLAATAITEDIRALAMVLLDRNDDTSVQFPEYIIDDVPAKLSTAHGAVDRRTTSGGPRA